MSGYFVIDQLIQLNVRVVSDSPGRIKLQSADDHIPVKAIEIAKHHKGELLKMIDRSSGAAPCLSCGNQLIAVPTFDGYENFECMTCGRCFGTRQHFAQRTIEASHDE